MSIPIRTCAEHNKRFFLRESLSLYSLHFSLCGSMAASVDPLVVGRVIGDVLDMFIPTANMSVYFGPKHITNGCEIKPSAAVNPPKVNISGNSNELYTLVYILIFSLLSIFCASLLSLTHTSLYLRTHA